MVLAYHVIFCAYGFWLPNDPRGSWSDFVRSWELFLHGRATTTSTRKSVAAIPHNRTKRLTQKRALRHNPVTFTGLQGQSIANGFAHSVQRSHFTIHACSILPQHIHMVIARHKYQIEQVINQLKGEATKELNRPNRHPFPNTVAPSGKQHSPWADDSWDVYLNTPHEIRRAITYVKNNPLKENRHPQNFSFLTPYPV